MTRTGRENTKPTRSAPESSATSSARSEAADLIDSGIVKRVLAPSPIGRKAEPRGWVKGCGEMARGAAPPSSPMLREQNGGGRPSPDAMRDLHRRRAVRSTSLSDHAGNTADHNAQDQQCGIITKRGPSRRRQPGRGKGSKETVTARRLATAKATITSPAEGRSVSRRFDAASGEICSWCRWPGRTRRDHSIPSVEGTRNPDAAGPVEPLAHFLRLEERNRLLVDRMGASARLRPVGPACA
jgi:hypothetical protein